MNEGDSLSLLALIIDLLAFIIAIGQLLQQIFGTADGFRRCQTSVMGPWAKKTRLRWRWSEFRFETKFTTPQLHVTSKPYELGIIEILSLGRGHSPSSLGIDPNFAAFTGSKVVDPEVATWVKFCAEIWWQQLHSVADLTSEILFSDGMVVSLSGTTPDPSAVLPESAQETRCRLRPVERSWDLMPPDTIVPYATTTVKDFIVLAHRLDMQWIELDPYRGRMIAQGCGHLLSPAVVRGAGSVVRYDYDSSYCMRREELDDEETWWGRTYISSQAADKLHCGIVPMNQHFTALTDAQLIADDSTLSDLPEALSNGYFHNAKLIEACTNLAQVSILDGLGDKTWHYHCAINEWISLNVVYLPVNPAACRRIAWPLPMRTVTSVMGSAPGRYAILDRLRKVQGEHAVHISGPLVVDVFPGLSKSPLQHLHHLAFEYRPFSTNECGPNAIPMRARCMTELARIYDETTSFFKSDLVSVAEGFQSSLLLPLIEAHTELSMSASVKAEESMRNGQARKPRHYQPTEADHPIEAQIAAAESKEEATDFWDVAWGTKWTEKDLFLSELGHQYFDNIAVIFDHLKHYDYIWASPEQEIVERAWEVLLRRGICWWLSVVIVPQTRIVPSRMYYKQMPVYLT